MASREAQWQRGLVDCKGGLAGDFNNYNQREMPADSGKA